MFTHNNWGYNVGTILLESCKFRWASIFWRNFDETIGITPLCNLWYHYHINMLKNFNIDGITSVPFFHFFFYLSSNTITLSLKSLSLMMIIMMSITGKKCHRKFCITHSARLHFVPCPFLKKLLNVVFTCIHSFIAHKVWECLINLFPTLCACLWVKKK